MSQNSRVIWSEGLLLAPQHLQQWDRHLQHLIRSRLRASSAFDWGFVSLEIDEESLRNGRVALKEARGILPEGTPFSMPEQDPMPPARAIEGHFGTKQDTLPVYLGLPAARPGRPQLSDPNSPARPGTPTPRYSPDEVELADDTTASNERRVSVARPNFTVLFPDDALGEYDVLPMAEVLRTGEGSYTLRDDYIPPSLSIGATEVLMRKLRSELEMMITKSGELSGRRRQRGSDIAEFSASESAHFWLLHGVNTYIPVLSHYVGHRRAHPEDVYLSLAAFAGALCTYSTELAAKDLPAYEHRSLGATFAGIHSVLARLIQTVISSKAVRIDLEKRDGSIYVGQIHDPRLLEPSSSLYLGVRADLEEQRLVSDLPAKIKIASLDQIDFLIDNALRGVPIRFNRVPPASLPAKASYLYFELDSGADAWSGVKGSQNIAIFAPPDVPGITLELLGIRE
jgi:type VI secretion system protein ImpJ